MARAPFDESGADTGLGQKPSGGETRDAAAHDNDFGLVSGHYGLKFLT